MSEKLIPIPDFELFQTWYKSFAELREIPETNAYLLYVIAWSHGHLQASLESLRKEASQ